nr:MULTISPECIES: hemolysin family protein [unclassified Paenibacillus]
MITEIVVLLILILINAFFAASEIALISLNDNKVKAMAEEGDKKSQMLYNLLKEPSRFLATIQIGITLAGFMASAFAADTFAKRFARFAYEVGIPIPPKILDSVSLIVITLILSYFTLVFGELVPKRLAMKKAEPISMIAVRPLTVLSLITAPFVKLLTFSMNVTVRLFGVDPNSNEEEVTEEEIRMMVDVGNESGAIQEAERMMINNIFDFDNKEVSDIMTHRIHIVAISADAPFKEVVRIMNEEKYTRYPVYGEGIDDIVGILHVKDMIQFMDNCNEDAFDLRTIMRKPYHVPMHRMTDEVFRDLQLNKVHMAVVIDEYGGTAGIVTAEDLLEEIVGNIFDEHDEEIKDIVEVSENTYLINGITDLEDVEEVLRIGLPVDDYETVSGFVIGQLGRLPAPGEKLSVEFKGAVFQVIEADEKFIKKIKVTNPLK